MDVIIPALCFGGVICLLGMTIFVWGPEEQKKEIMEEVRKEMLLKDR